MRSTVLFTRSIRRSRSKLVRPRLRMMSELRTISRPRLHRQRRYSRAFFLAGMVGSRPAKWLALLYVMLPQLVDASRDVRDAVLQDLFGDLFLVEDDKFLHRAHTALQ